MILLYLYQINSDEEVVPYLKQVHLQIKFRVIIHEILQFGK